MGTSNLSTRDAGPRTRRKKLEKTLDVFRHRAWIQEDGGSQRRYRRARGAVPSLEPPALPLRGAVLEVSLVLEEPVV